MVSISISTKKTFENCYDEAKIMITSPLTSCEVYTVINKRVIKNLKKFITEIERDGYSNADLHTPNDSLYLEYINKTLNVYTTNSVVKISLTVNETKTLIECLYNVINSYKTYKSIGSV